MVENMGIEPITFRLQGSRSSQLELVPHGELKVTQPHILLRFISKVD